jgi:hypothetical protein
MFANTQCHHVMTLKADFKESVRERERERERKSDRVANYMPYIDTHVRQIDVTLLRKQENICQSDTKAAS